MGRFEGGILWARCVGMARDCAREARWLATEGRRGRPHAGTRWREMVALLRERAREHVRTGRTVLGGRAPTFERILAELSAGKAGVR